MKLRRIKRVIVGGLAVAALTGALSLSALAGDYVSVAKNSVNVRSGPDTSYKVLYELPIDYPLSVMSRKGQWLKVVDVDGDKGWIYEKLVSNTPFVIVTSKECNIRSGPGTDTSIVGTVVKDVLLKKEGSKGDWIRISHAQVEGWIHRNLVWPR
ncbi:MAG: peptide-binding protein [Desulfobulbus propionicus]|nr:MAG: peptide-binding protein [Desulfobulbus propionicus]